MNYITQGIWSTIIGENIVLNKISKATSTETEKEEKINLSALGTQTWFTYPLNFVVSDYAQQINKSILNLYGKFLSEDGKYVDYLGISKSEEFHEFEMKTQLLPQIHLQSLEEDERKAFFLNIYNALVIHSIIKHGVPSSTIEKIGFYQRMCYEIGGFIFSLDDIEHGIFRCNKKAPAFFIRHPQFGKGDARLSLVSKNLDPRIHFALVCGAQSCPPIRIYNAQNLEKGLQLAAEAFCGSDLNVSIDCKTKEVTLSQIFLWYGSDFGKDEKELLKAIASFLSEPKKSQLTSLLSDNVKISYRKYDWSVNTKNQLPTSD